MAKMVSKQAPLRRENSASLQQGALKTVSGGYLETNSDGVIALADPAAAALFHASPRRMIGRSLAAFVCAEHADRVRQTLLLAKGAGRAVELEASVPGAEGQAHPVWLAVLALPASAGEGPRFRWLALERDGSTPDAAMAGDRDDLERLIQQRTADLLKTNELFGQEIESRKRTEAALLKARDELESRVIARTEELAVANEMLQQELAERKRAEEAAARRTRELSALHAATTALHYTLELEPLLGQILDAAVSAIPAAEKGLLHLIARDTGQLEMRAFVGFSDERIQRFSLPGSRNYVAQAVQERKPLLLGNLQNELSAIAEAPGGGAQSAIVAPLIIENDILGAVALESSARRAFSQGDLRLLVSFAVTASAAIRNGQLHAEMQKLAITDSLTGLYNRHGFYELARREIERAQRFQRPLAAMMLDFDNFKDVNDRYGHAAGDLVLRVVAQYLLSYTRQIDLVGRYGGDEFCLLLPETDLPAASELAERLRSGVAELPVVVEGKPIAVTISLGVTKATPDMADLNSLLRSADEILYRAKQSGRNRVAVG